jgi:hypothetical protein
MSDFVPMAAIGVGAYLLWFGIHYWRSAETTYPHTVIKSVVSGGGLPSNAASTQEPSRAAATKAQLTGDQAKAATDSGSGTAPATSTGTPGAGAGSTTVVPATGTAQALPADTALTGANATAWADAILTTMGAPTTAANVSSMVNWFAHEGGGGANNPMNTTLQTSGSTGSINAVGVQSYSTVAAGVAATVQTLNGGNYPAIVAALKAGTGLSGGSGAVASELSTWSGGGYDSV